MANASKKARGTGLIVAAIISLAALILFTVFFAATFRTTTYYVLSQDVPARTQITSDMITPKEVSTGGQPETSLSREQIEGAPIFAKADLHAGEPITASTAGDLDPVNKNIPENFTVASITLPPESANLGAIHSGDHINLYLIEDDEMSDTQKARMVMQNLLVVNAGASVETAVAKTADEGGESQTQVNTVYQVAVSPEDAATLAVLSSQSNNLYATLTPATGVVSGPVISDLPDLDQTAKDASSGANDTTGKGE